MAALASQVVFPGLVIAVMAAVAGIVVLAVLDVSAALAGPVFFAGLVLL
jgi:hypothetical protein